MLAGLVTIYSLFYMHFEFSYNKPSIFDQPIHIKQILPREGSQIVENGSFVIADIIASMEDGSIISLDTFRSVVQNIDTEQKAWLSFLTADDPDEIVRLVNAYPEFLPCYRDIISFRRRPKDLITTFSDALREMDRNTEIYMVEQLAKEVQEKDHALAEKDNAIAEKDNAIAEQAKLIEQLKKQLAETCSTD